MALVRKPKRTANVEIELAVKRKTEKMTIFRVYRELTVDPSCKPNNPVRVAV